MPTDGGEREGAGDARRHASATLRNRDAIATVIEPFLPETGIVLEVASGTGEHIIHFAKRWPHLAFQPSDPDPTNRASVAAWIAHEGATNVKPPIDLDTTGDAWWDSTADVVFCANMIHIAPWIAALGLMTGAGRILRSGGRLMLYGPFKRGGRHTAPSNEAFDRSLRARDPAWGVRDLEEVERAASAAGLSVIDRTEMPANNMTIVFEKL